MLSLGAQMHDKIDMYIKLMISTFSSPHVIFAGSLMANFGNLIAESMAMETIFKIFTDWMPKNITPNLTPSYQRFGNILGTISTA